MTKTKKIKMRIFITHEQNAYIMKILSTDYYSLKPWKSKINTHFCSSNNLTSTFTKPWKNQIKIHVDKTLYFHFKNGKPEKIEYLKKNLGVFYIIADPVSIQSINTDNMTYTSYSINTLEYSCVEWTICCMNQIERIIMDKKLDDFSIHITPYENQKFKFEIYNGVVCLGNFKF